MTRLASVFGGLVLCLSVGCGSTTRDQKPAPLGEDKPVKGADGSHYTAPPFSADDLRAGLPAGTEITLRIEQLGKDPVVQHWTFTAADENGCTIHARVLAEDGSLIKDEGAGTTTWAELVTHAHFPAAQTTRSDSSIDVPAGHFETWLFEVEPAQSDGATKRLHFARELPGPPVWMEIEQGEKVVLKMVLVSRKQP